MVALGFIENNIHIIDTVLRRMEQPSVMIRMPASEVRVPWMTPIRMTGEKEFS